MDLWWEPWSKRWVMILYVLVWLRDWDCVDDPWKLQLHSIHRCVECLKGGIRRGIGADSSFTCHCPGSLATYVFAINSLSSLRLSVCSNISLIIFGRSLCVWRRSFTNWCVSQWQQLDSMIHGSPNLDHCCMSCISKKLQNYHVFYFYVVFEHDKNQMLKWKPSEIC